MEVTVPPYGWWSRKMEERAGTSKFVRLCICLATLSLDFLLQHKVNGRCFHPVTSEVGLLGSN